MCYLDERAILTYCKWIVADLPHLSMAIRAPDVFYERVCQASPESWLEMLAASERWFLPYGAIKYERLGRG